MTTTRRRSRRREVWFIFATSLVLIAPFLIYVRGHFEIVETSYDMEAIDRHRSELEHENRALRVERARLMALPRIEKEARALGFEPVPIDRLIVVRAPRTTLGAPPTPTPPRDRLMDPATDPVEPR